MATPHLNSEHIDSFSNQNNSSSITTGFNNFSNDVNISKVVIKGLKWRAPVIYFDQKKLLF